MRRVKPILASLAAIALVAVAPASPAHVTAPRTPLGDEPLVLAPVLEQRLVVKFTDDSQARADAATGGVRSLAGRDLSAAARLAALYHLRFKPLIRLPESTLRHLEERAASRSNAAQPDLAGMLIARPTPGGSHTLAEICTALRTLPEVEFAYLETLGVPPPGDIAPPTPDLVSNQTYRGSNPGMDADYAWSVGATGGGVRLSDCEYGWNPAHEDLNDIDLRLEPGQTIHPDVYANSWQEHGTSVLGETSAVPNAYGCSGMVPDAAVYTWPEWTVEEGSRRVTCITNAVASSDAGDVVLLEMQAFGAGGNFGPAELDMAVWTVVKAGTDAGVIVVGAAGNGNQDLDSPAYTPYLGRGDSGAMIVGAGTPFTQHAKVDPSTYGSRVNMQGWSYSVFTLGEGSYATYGGDPNQRYSLSFSGTSAAAPFVASACVAMQSLALATTGVPLTPLALRQLLVDTGRPQGGSGGHIGPFPDMRAAITQYLSTVSVGDPAPPHAGAELAVFPNPIRTTAEVRLSLPGRGPFNLSVFDHAGRRIRDLLRGETAARTQRATWEGLDATGRPVAPGIYYVRLEGPGGSRVAKRVVLVR